MAREDILININIRWLKFYKEEESGRRIKCAYEPHLEGFERSPGAKESSSRNHVSSARLLSDRLAVKLSVHIKENGPRTKLNQERKSPELS